jgi:hypothetical protein
MKNAWLYVLSCTSYPKDTFCIMFTGKTRQVVERELCKTHFSPPRLILGYAIADYDAVSGKIQKLYSKGTFIQLPINELKQKIQSAIGKAPTKEQLDILKFVGGYCVRLGESRSTDLYKLYRKTGGRETVTRFTHLMSTLGVRRKRHKVGIIFDQLEPKEADCVKKWWVSRIKDKTHKLYQKPAKVYEEYCFTTPRPVPEAWFWRRLGFVVEYKRMKLSDKSTAITFPSLELCETIIEMDNSCD